MTGAHRRSFPWLPGLLAAALSSAAALAAEPAAVIVDGQGNPIRGSSGNCIALPGDKITDLRCLSPEKVAEIKAREEKAAEATKPKPRAAYVEYVTRVPFDRDSAGLSQAAQDELLGLLVALEQYFKVTKVAITGHTDITGSAPYNQWLSEKRAESVQAYFRSSGVDPRMMSISGAGETQLRSDIAPDAAGQRRVEIYIEILMWEAPRQGSSG